MKIKNQKSKIKNRRLAFTLLELLVAISILTIIVMMMSGVFFQSRVAWSSGLRRSRLNMEGRALIDFMANELAQAVASEDFPFKLTGNGVEFYMLEDPTVDDRVLTRVAYSYSDSDRKVSRHVWKIEYDDYPDQEAPEQQNDLARNVQNFSLAVPDEWDSAAGTNLPRWVDIELSIQHESDIARVKARSWGPDREPGTADDIQAN